MFPENLLNTNKPMQTIVLCILSFSYTISVILIYFKQFWGSVKKIQIIKILPVVDSFLNEVNVKKHRFIWLEGGANSWDKLGDDQHGLLTS